MGEVCNMHVENEEFTHTNSWWGKSGGGGVTTRKTYEQNVNVS
jgi:hypothetical protein